MLYGYVQTDPEIHPAFSLPEVERPGICVDHPPDLAPRLKKEYNYTSTPPLGFHGLF
jgi:hypothetical protein